MSLLTEAILDTAAPASSTDSSSTPVTTAHYTICPVLVASNIAVEFGWPEEEFKRAGVNLRYLRSLPESIGWLPHFSHRLDNLFRDGGNIPSIWAKADNTDTTLIGLTFGPGGGQILVRSSDNIHRISDLKDRRVGLYRSLNIGKVDWWRATSDRAFELALNLHGLQRSHVQWFDISHGDDLSNIRAQKPSELWKHRFQAADFVESPEVRALRAGIVDAIYINAARAQSLVETGEFAVIEDLERYPDWTLQLANSPYAITVNTEFAKNHPEAVVAFLRASIRAGRWANAHPEAAAQIFQRVTYYPDTKTLARKLATLDLVPKLSPQNLAGVQQVKAFLLARGYIRNDFTVQNWANPSFLNQALSSL